jgi:hypothetical protein
MNSGQYVFSQLIALLSTTSFRTCVSRYKGDHKVKEFSCWKQFLCMSFGQLTQRESLSDTIICLGANEDKLYHLGIGKIISKSTLSKANENRDWRIFADYAMVLIARAKLLYSDDNFSDLELTNNVFAIDATTIDLCLSTFTWATFRKTKAAIKVHLQLDVKTAIPEFIHITNAKIHEVNVLDKINFAKDNIYLLDRGYLDYKRLYRINLCEAFFVIRSKDNCHYTRLYSNECDKSKGIKCDQIIRFTNYYSAKDYPVKLRRIKYFDLETSKTLVFLTNNFELSATDIALLYKHRWRIELFFKWVKQHLKIKSFWGQSENAVKTQVWIAISTYVLVAIAKKEFQVKQSLYEMLQILSVNIFEKKPINAMFQRGDLQKNSADLDNQLSIFE